jgi:hypothetical protein
MTRKIDSIDDWRREVKKWKRKLRFMANSLQSNGPDKVLSLYALDMAQLESAISNLLEGEANPDECRALVVDTLNDIFCGKRDPAHWRNHE